MMKKNLCLIAAHTSTDLHIDCLSSNIKYFKEICDKIVIVNSKDFKNDDKLKDKLDKEYPNDKIDYHYCANLVNLCHGKWLYYLDNIYEYNYDNILLANDSFLVINSLLPLKELHESNDYEMTGLVSSREGRWHCQDFIRFYSDSSINKIIDFYKENNIRFSHYKKVTEVDKKRRLEHYHYCIEAEKESCQLFSRQGCLFTLPLSYKKNINFDNSMLEDYIVNRNYPVIKIRKLKHTYYKEDFSESLPKDFEALEYKSVNDDLPFINVEELEDHFKKYGYLEGRLYKKNQKVKLPDYIKTFLTKEIKNYEENNEDKESN